MLSLTIAAMNKAVFSKLSGLAFRDGEGQRWFIRGTRPGPEGQYVIEAEMKGSYPRIAVYTMTEGEFRQHAKAAHLKPERKAAHPSPHPR